PRDVLCGVRMASIKHALPADCADELQRRADEFEAAWRRGEEPALGAFLPANDLPFRKIALLELVMIDLDHRWRQSPGDKRWRIEDYLKRVPELGPVDEVPIELLAEEYWVRHCWGDRPAHSEYAARFPRHAAALAESLGRIDAQLASELTEKHAPAQPEV